MQIIRIIFNEMLLASFLIVWSTLNDIILVFVHLVLDGLVKHGFLLLLKVSAGCSHIIGLVIEAIVASLVLYLIVIALLVVGHALIHSEF